MTTNALLLIAIYMSWLLLVRIDTASVYIATPELQSIYSGESLELMWMTSLPGKFILWCYWQHEVGTAWDRFLGYNNQETERLNISARHQGWDYTNSASPCHGGIRREDMTRYYGGRYQMIIGLYNGTEYESPISDVIVSACRALPDVINADRLVTMAADHVVVQYICHPRFPGFSENEAVVIQCVPDSGQWSEIPPNCQGFSLLEVALICSVVVVCVVLVILVIWLLIVTTNRKTDESDSSGRAKGDGSETGENSPLNPNETDPTGDIVIVRPSGWGKCIPRREKSSINTSRGPLEFSEVFPDMKVDLDKTLKLSVVVNSKSKISATWKRGDEVLTEEKNKYKMGKSCGNKFWLSLLKAREEMTGVYSCAITNKEEETVEHSANILVVTEGMCAPEFVESLENPLEVQAGTTIARRVVVKGKPLPKIICYMADAEIKETDIIRIDKSTTGSELMDLTITINQPKLSDMCKLKIEAQSQLGIASTGTSLVVKCDPIIQKVLLDKTVGIGEDAIFLVKLVANPLPVVRWFVYDRGSKCLVQSTHEKINQYTLRSQVEFVKCRPEQAGLILAEIIIENIVVATEQFRLYVRSPVKPQFTIKPKPVTTFVGCEATFTVQYNGHPHPDIEWFMRDERLDSLDRVRITFPDTSTSVLHISDCTVEDAGAIRVTAFNDVDTVKCSTTLKVSVKERKPTFTMKPKDTRLFKGEHFTFSAEADGVPTPSITWQSMAECKDGLTQGKGTLSISAARKEHSGSYKVTAKNSAGSVYEEFMVTVVDGIQNQAEKDVITVQTNGSTETKL